MTPQEAFLTGLHDEIFKQAQRRNSCAKLVLKVNRDHSKHMPLGQIIITNGVENREATISLTPTYLEAYIYDLNANAFWEEYDENDDKTFNDPPRTFVKKRVVNIADPSFVVNEFIDTLFVDMMFG